MKVYFDFINLLSVELDTNDFGTMDELRKLLSNSIAKRFGTYFLPELFLIFSDGDLINDYETLTCRMSGTNFGFVIKGIRSGDLK